MNWAQFKDPVSHMCLADTVVASWPLTPEVAVSSPFTVMTNIFVTEFPEFSETFRKNSTVYKHTADLFLIITSDRSRILTTQSDATCMRQGSQL